MKASSNDNHLTETRTKATFTAKSSSNEKSVENDDSTEEKKAQILPVKKPSTAAMALKERVTSMTNLALENIGLDTKMEGPTWSTKWESIAATLSFVICSHNLWFFPFLCGYYGGYFPFQFSVCFLLIAVPLLYIEMALGQYASASPLSVFSRIVPAMAGLSAGMCFILVFRTISLSVWAIYELTISVYATTAIWRTPPWKNCSLEDIYCTDYKLNNCTWARPGFSAPCDHYQRVLVATRGITQKKSPVMSCVHNMMFRRSIIAADWTPPSFTAIGCAIVIWAIVGVISIGGSKVLGKTGAAVLVLSLIGTVVMISYGISLPDTSDVVRAFLYQEDDLENTWMWVWSWADAAAHSVRALNVACGGIQKFSALNNFHNKIHRDVLIISITSFVFYICTGLFSFMFIAELGRLYYANMSAGERIKLYMSPVLIEIGISEILSTLAFGSFWLFLFWFTMVLFCIQGISSDIWVISSMIVERINGSRRKYGKPLASWHKRAIILAVMCFAGLISALPFLGNGGVTLMSSIESYASYGTLFIAFVEVATISYLYGFKRFSVNIRAMIGGRGPPNIFWWLNWLVISPCLLIIAFGCIVATFGHRKVFTHHSLVMESIGWSLLVMPIFFVAFYFIREDIDRRRNMEPFSVMLRATGDWGPMKAEDRRKALKFERQLRVRY